MKRKYNLYQIDAFTKEPYYGNPAAVTFGMELTDREMQNIAREMNLSETAFILASDKADYGLRWFTPTKEVDICGHATIASLHYLNELDKIQNRKRITFDTRSGLINCTVSKDSYSMYLPIPIIEEFDSCKDEILEALDLDKSYVSDKYPFLILDNGYLYIFVNKLSALESMRPDFNLLYDLSLKCSFSCVDVFTLETYDKESFAHSRLFDPGDGIQEDPVTGSANGPLMLVLQKLGFLKITDQEITKIFEQGDIIGRKGRVSVTFSPKENKLCICGNAVTVFKGELYI